eukprot:303598-Amorphochlora_amoeboformis.AAC.1
MTVARPGAGEGDFPDKPGVVENKIRTCLFDQLGAGHVNVTFVSHGCEFSRMSRGCPTPRIARAFCY